MKHMATDVAAELGTAELTAKVSIDVLAVQLLLEAEENQDESELCFQMGIQIEELG